MEKNDIILIHGTNYKVMAKKVMEAANVAEDIGDKKKKIALKPNLVTAKAPSSGATTHSCWRVSLNTCRNTVLKILQSWRDPGSVTAPVKHSAQPVTTWSAHAITFRLWICSVTPGRNTMPQA